MSTQWETYKFTPKKEDYEIFALNPPTTFMFAKYGRNDIVGKVPKRIFSKFDNVESWSASDSVFEDAFRAAIVDVFENPNFYS